MGPDLVGRARLGDLDRPLRVGITGAIGSGKTVFAEAFAAYPGVRRIDADRTGHEALRAGSPVLPAIVKRFGREILDEAGNVRRPVLAEKVFAAPARVEELNAVVHPWLLAALRRRIKRLNRVPGVAIVAVDAALLCEWGLSSEMDRVVVIEAPERMRRLWLERRGLSPAQFEARAAAQWPPAAKRRAGHIIIRNNRTERELRSAARRLAGLWSRALKTRRRRSK
ncbi:MAG: dephospho-CoA kinase [Candidatus Eisenbacteria bacterium]|nr:dephospho-CoA kinase [Candidatus Eisenbacteria bacterium]